VAIDIFLSFHLPPPFPLHPTFPLHPYFPLFPLLGLVNLGLTSIPNTAANLWNFRFWGWQLTSYVFCWRFAVSFFVNVHMRIKVSYIHCYSVTSESFVTCGYICICVYGVFVIFVFCRCQHIYINVLYCSSSFCLLFLSSHTHTIRWSTSLFLGSVSLGLTSIPNTATNLDRSLLGVAINILCTLGNRKFSLTDDFLYFCILCIFFFFPGLQFVIHISHAYQGFIHFFACPCTYGYRSYLKVWSIWV
jgi:hypothetical protein